MYRTLMAPLVYVIAIALSFFRPELSLALYALVPIGGVSALGKL
jgi:hypothetical protein